jgi:heme A synthase
MRPISGSPDNPLHFRAFSITVGWTLALLFLGSVVHATQSSLACPDWPTCNSSLMPLMEGGVFWEHLHRLVAGGLILMFALATWLVRQEAPHAKGLFRACLGGLTLLFVQAVFGGLTVIFKLPTAVSTTHLALAFGFLALAVALAAASSPVDRRPVIEASTARTLRVWAGVPAALIFAQSLLGALVRHTESGLACPDVPTCLGSWMPDVPNAYVAIQLAHRAFAVLAALAVIAATLKLLSVSGSKPVRAAAALASALVVVQVGLGVLAVTTRLAVLPVSLHTLVAAALFGTLVLLSTWGWVGTMIDAPLRSTTNRTQMV